DYEQQQPGFNQRIDYGMTRDAGRQAPSAHDIDGGHDRSENERQHDTHQVESDMDNAKRNPGNQDLPKRGDTDAREFRDEVTAKHQFLHNRGHDSYRDSRQFEHAQFRGIRPDLGIGERI